MDSIDKAQEGSFSVKQPPRLFFAALFLIFVVLALFVNQIPGLYANQKGNLSEINIVFFSFLLVLELILGALIASLARLFYFKKANSTFFSIFIILTIALSIGVFSSSYISPPYTDVVYNFSISEKMASFISGTGTLFALYAVVVYGPLLKHSRSSLTFILELFVVYAIVAIIYSLIAEWDLYAAAFSNKDYFFAVEALSFVNNKNVFPTSLLIAIMAELLLIHYSKNIFRMIPVFVFSYFVLLCHCKTAIVLVPALLLLFFLVQAILNWKKKTYYFWFNLICFILLGISIGLVLLDPFNLIDFSAMFEDFWTIKSRILLWRFDWSLISKYPLNSLFGFGDHLYNMMVAKDTPFYLNTYGYSHNAFLETIGTGGFFRLVVYVALLGLMIAVFIKRIKQKRSDVWVLLFYFCLILGRSMIENEAFFNFNYESMAFLVIILIPLFSEDSMKKSAVHVYKPTAGHPSCLLLASVLILILLPIAACYLGTIWAFALLLIHGIILVTLGIKESSYRLPLTILTLDIIGFALAYNIGSDSVTILGFSIAWAVLIIMLFWGYSIKKGYKLTCSLENTYSSLIAKMDQRIPE